MKTITMNFETMILLVGFIALTACGLLEGGDGGPDIPGTIVFAANDGAGNSQIFTMRADGSQLRQLTSLENDEAYMPSWSTDGRQIVFSTSLRSSSNGLSLYIMDADGGNMRPMNEREGSHIPTPGHNARWSPDGGRIAFDLCTNCQVGTNIELFIYEFATDSLIQLTDTDFPLTNSYPAWSPDGGRIAFVSNRDYVDAETRRFRQDLYVTNVDGTELQRLTINGFVGLTAWHPESTHIAFAASGLHLVDLSNGSISKIELDLPEEFQHKVRPVRWSENGEQLLLAVTEINKKTAFYLFNKDKDTIRRIPFGPTQISGADWYIPDEN